MVEDIIKNVMLNIKKQYKSSFFFGIKLVIILSLFVVFPLVAFMVSSGVDKITREIPALYISKLKITSMQDFEYGIKPKYWWKVYLTSGETIYFTLNRKFNNNDELKAAQKEAVDLFNNTYSVERIKVEKGIIYSIPASYGTVLYGYHTGLGNLIVVPINIILVILCLASFFSIFKAVFNLFRFKRIFREDRS